MIRMIALVIAALILLAVFFGISAALWYYLFWPLFFEQWLGPLPVRGALGIGFVWVILNSGLRRAAKDYAEEKS